jgi:hypothetical protein
MDAPTEEFRAFVINLYTDYGIGGPTKALSMLNLLDLFDTVYNLSTIYDIGLEKRTPKF